MFNVFELMFMFNILEFGIFNVLEVASNVIEMEECQ